MKYNWQAQTQEKKCNFFHSMNSDQPLTLLYPCSSNHPLSYRCWAVFGMARIKFSRETLSIESINTLSGRLLFNFSLYSVSRFRIIGRSRIIACVFLYIVFPIDETHFTNINSMVGGSFIVSLNFVHDDNLINYEWTTIFPIDINKINLKMCSGRVECGAVTLEVNRISIAAI